MTVSILFRSLVAAAVAVGLSGLLHAQAPAAPAGAQSPATPQSIAPINLTGTWVSVVSEDWRWRMMTPAKGDYASLPLTDAGRKAADSWDYQAAQTPENACKPFGVGNIMRMPGRLRISWQNPSTLKLEFDAGTQTRLFNFDRAKQATGEKTWQGFSTAQWETPGGGGRGPVRAQIGNNAGPVVPGGGGRGQRGGPPPASSLSQGGALKVVTTNFREGYLRKNGVPYSENASITEYFHRLPAEPGEETFLLVITVIEDPRYLSGPFYTSTQFKLERDGAKFAPSPCRTAPPPK